jgi:O-antigen/teichoic acid export membrane protein
LGSAVFVADSAEQLAAGSDQVVAGAFLGVAAVTPYAIALKLSQGASLLTDQFVKVLFPMAAELHAGRNRDHLRLLYATGTRLTLAINVPVTCTLIILAQPVLRVWVGEAYTADSWLATILLLSALAARSQAVGRTVLQAMGRQWPLAILGVCSGVANIVMSIALVGPLGLLGVAIGTLVPNVILYLLIMLPFAVRTIGVPVLSALKEILWPALVPAVPCVAVLLALRELRDLSSLPLLVAAAAAGVVTYGVTYLSMSASKLERETCRGVASQGVRLASSLLKSH